MLQELDDGSVLLRLAHLYEVNDKKHHAPLCTPIDASTWDHMSVRQWGHAPISQDTVSYEGHLDKC